MECPACTNPTEQTQQPDGSIRFYCPHCGWGSGPPADLDEVHEPKRPEFSAFALVWLGALAAIFGPYLALRFGAPALLDIGIASLDDAAGRFVAALDIHYWWIYALYVFLAAAFTPTVDRDNLGWFGGMMDNPFSLSDDFERTKLGIAILLYPGKIVVAALVQTWAAVKPS